MGEHKRTVKRVERSFAFIDISGFTAYTDEHGDDAAVAALSHFRTLVRDVAASRGVRVSKWLGDGAMMVAIELTTLVEAVTEICADAASADDVMPLRAGVASGRVILMEGDDHIGGAVNLAARLCDRAQAGEVLAPDQVAQALPVGTTARSIGAHKVRGIAQPIELVLLEPA